VSEFSQNFFKKFQKFPNKYWNKLRLAPSISHPEVPSPTTLRPPRTTSPTVEAPGVALITCSLHCTSSGGWRHHLIARPRPFPNPPIPDLPPSGHKRLFAAGGCAR